MIRGSLEQYRMILRVMGIYGAINEEINSRRNKELRKLRDSNSKPKIEFGFLILENLRKFQEIKI